MTDQINREKDFCDTEFFIEFKTGTLCHIRPFRSLKSGLKTLAGITCKDRETENLARACLIHLGYEFITPDPEARLYYIFRPNPLYQQQMSEHEKLRAIRRFRFVQENQAGPISIVRDRGTLDHPYI